MKNNHKFDCVKKSIFDWWDKNHNNNFDIKKPLVRLHEPTFGPEEITVFTEQLLTTNVTMGEKVREFENKYCELMGFNYGVSNNSGSSANLLILAALSNNQYKNKLNPGDEIIIPALTWSTSLWPIIQYGMIPSFVDCDRTTLNLDKDSILKAINSKTKAIMAVSIYGNPCDFDMLLDICRKYNLILIEDSCESMGAMYRGKYIGSFGVASSFSFYYSHHITTLEGGICITNDPEINDLMRIIRAHGWIRQIDDKEKYTKLYPEFDSKFLFVNEGYNLRITEPQAAMGLIQVKKLLKFIDLRQKNAEFLSNALSKYDKYFSFQKETDNGKHSWFGFIIMIKENSPFTRNDICKFLNNNGIETRVIVAGNLARHPGVKIYPHKINTDLKNSDYIMNYGFSIAVHQSLCSDSKNYIITVFDNFFKSKGIK